EQFAVTVDGGEHVVEVMGDPARQFAYGLHLLGLDQGLLAFAQVFFRLLALADVHGRAYHALGAPLPVPENLGAAIQPAIAAVGSDSPEFHLAFPRAFQRPFHGSTEGGGVFGVEALRERVETALDGPVLQSHEFMQSSRSRPSVGADAPFPGSDFSRVQGEAEPLFAFAQAGKGSP